MKEYCFTVDDNIRCLKELTSCTKYQSIFEHPYFGMYRRLHEKYGVKVQLNLFYEMDDFNLSRMTDRFKKEWEANSDWLKFSFHSRMENIRPYEDSGYDEVYIECQMVQREIMRFASPSLLGKTTTIHYSKATKEGLQALKDSGIGGLLGLYGSEEAPRASYQNTPAECADLRKGYIVTCEEIAYAGIDIVLNMYSIEEILSKLKEVNHRELIKIMIHEQYFYPDYALYQDNFEEKISAAFEYLSDKKYESIFFEEKINMQNES